MSQRNVDLFLEASDAFNRRDLERWLALYDPDVAFDPQLTALEGSFDGHDGLRRFFAEIGERFDDFQLEYADVRDLGDRVLALGKVRGRGKGSGVEIEGQVAFVVSFRDEKIIRFRDHGDHREGLRAVGMSE
jgi:ketosteroid isomerase-like protein